MIQPSVYKNVVPIPADVLAFAEREFRTHYDEWGTDESLSFAGGLGGEVGRVAMHTDFDFPRDQCVWGLILVSEGHELIVGDYHKLNILFRAALEPGDVYRIDPSVMHGTETRVPDGRIIFAVTDRPIIGDVLEPIDVAKLILSECRDEMQRAAKGACYMCSAAPDASHPTEGHDADCPVWIMRDIGRKARQFA